MSETRPVFLLAGVGAVGAYFGGRLAAGTGADVRVIARSDYDAVCRDGYTITSPDGDFVFCPSQVYRGAEECDVAPDYLMVSSKVLPGVDVPAMIVPAVKPDTTIVLIQNGIDIEAPVKAAFPGHELISGIAYVGVTRVAPGRIVHTDGGTLKFGVYPSGRSARCDALAGMFTASGIPSVSCDDIQRVRWEKLTWNAPYNPVSVLTRSNTRQIMDDPDALRLIRSVMDEVMTLAAADGWALPPELPEKLLNYTAGFRPYKPSMMADFENGRPMEIEAILGNALRIAGRLGVEVPHLCTVYSLISLLQKNTLVREKA